MYPTPSPRDRSSTETFHGPTRVAQTNHKEIACFCLQASRHGVGNFCAISLAFGYQNTPQSQPVAFVTRTVASSIYILLHHAHFLLLLLLLPTSCLFLRPAGGGPSWIAATMVLRVKAPSVISVQFSLLLNVFTNRTEQMSKRLTLRRFLRLLQVPPREANRDCC